MRFRAEVPDPDESPRPTGSRRQWPGSAGGGLEGETGESQHDHHRIEGRIEASHER